MEWYFKDIIYNSLIKIGTQYKLRSNIKKVYNMLSTKQPEGELKAPYYLSSRKLIYHDMALTFAIELNKSIPSELPIFVYGRIFQRFKILEEK